MSETRTRSSLKFNFGQTVQRTAALGTRESPLGAKARIMSHHKIKCQENNAFDWTKRVGRCEKGPGCGSRGLRGFGARLEEQAVECTSFAVSKSRLYNQSWYAWPPWSVIPLRSPAIARSNGHVARPPTSDTNTNANYCITVQETRKMTARSEHL